MKELQSAFQAALDAGDRVDVFAFSQWRGAWSEERRRRRRRNKTKCKKRKKERKNFTVVPLPSKANLFSSVIIEHNIHNSKW